ncbi:MAG TPA: TIGR00730 family Rossman fold protein [Kineosporiaceae bacterium]|nr:TIGR00730 family Rossman fold protein [Kineosporiaceae bacterium]
MARVCVYCASSERIHPSYVALAEEVGRRLAERGHDLVSGGGRVSMMGAVARAVRAGGRHTLGVIPQALVGWEVADNEADALVVTADMRERKGRMDEAADAFLALPGGLGTLEELLEVWVARTLGMHDKPVVVLDPQGLFGGLQTLVDKLVSQGFVRPAAAAATVWAATVDEAMLALDAGLAARELARVEGGPSSPPPAAEEILEAEA